MNPLFFIILWLEKGILQELDGILACVVKHFEWLVE